MTGYSREEATWPGLADQFLVVVERLPAASSLRVAPPMRGGCILFAPELLIERVEVGDLRADRSIALQAVAGVKDGGIELRSRFDAIELILTTIHLEVFGEADGADVPARGKLHRHGLIAY